MRKQHVSSRWLYSSMMAISALVALGGHSAQAQWGSQVFNDEFSYSGTPDGNKWSQYSGQFESSSNRDPNNHRYYCYFTPSNLSVSGGTNAGTIKMKITKDSGWNGNFLSSGVDTKFRHEQTYGKYEVRAKFPTGFGTTGYLGLFDKNTWPPEVDFAEVLGKDPTHQHHTVHFTTDSSGHEQDQHEWWGPDFTTSWHTYTLEWTPNGLNYFVDGTWRGYTSERFYGRPMFFAMASGTGAPGTWVDSPNWNTFGTSTMEVDYVRIWSYSGSTAPVGRRMGFKAYNNKYVAADLGDSSFLKANWADSIGSWEQFDVVDAGGGAIALRSVATGKYVTADLSNSEARLRADWATSIQGWEKFEWVDRGNGKFALKCLQNGKFVSWDDNTWQKYLKAQWATGVGGWEEFTLTLL